MIVPLITAVGLICKCVFRIQPKLLNGCTPYHMMRCPLNSHLWWYVFLGGPSKLLSTGSTDSQVEGGWYWAEGSLNYAYWCDGTLLLKALAYWPSQSSCISDGIAYHPGIRWSLRHQSVWFYELVTWLTYWMIIPILAYTFNFSGEGARVSELKLQSKP